MREANRIPIIKLWSQLLVPLQGDVADHQAERMREDVLSRIEAGGIRGLIVDASGVWMMDSHLCAVIARLSGAARLMGVSTVMCGASPEVVVTLQTMGVDLGMVRSSLTLEEALSGFGIGPRAGDDSRSDRRRLMTAMLDREAAERGDQPYDPGRTT